MEYTPDLDMFKKLPDRKYICDILHTIQPQFVEEVVDHVLNIRTNLSVGAIPEKPITMVKEWADLLLQNPIFQVSEANRNFVEHR